MTKHLGMDANSYASAVRLGGRQFFTLEVVRTFGSLKNVQKHNVIYYEFFNAALQFARKTQGLREIIFCDYSTIYL